jgi:phosphomannomutase
MSGHIFFCDGYLGFDDGLYAAVRLANIVAHSGDSLAQMLATIPSTFSTPEIRIDCADTRKFAVVEEVRTRLHARAKAGESLQINEVDGVRVNVAQGWWLMRASNTQAALIVRCEAQQEADLASLVAMVEAELRACGVDMHVSADH